MNTPDNLTKDELGTVGHPEKMTRRQRLTTFAWSFGGFMVSYVALAGPMSALHRTVNNGPWQRCIEVVFFPIVLIVKSRIEPFASIIQAWCSLFR